jgi:hypothetical protein
VGQVFEDGAVDRGTSGAGRIAADHERGQAGLECSQLRELLPNLVQVAGSDVSHLDAGPVWLVNEPYKLPDLVNRKAEVSATPNERQTLDCRLAVNPPSGIGSRPSRE